MKRDKMKFNKMKINTIMKALLNKNDEPDDTEPEHDRFKYDINDYVDTASFRNKHGGKTRRRLL